MCWHRLQTDMVSRVWQGHVLTQTTLTTKATSTHWTRPHSGRLGWTFLGMSQHGASKGEFLPTGTALMDVSCRRSADVWRKLVLKKMSIVTSVIDTPPWKFVPSLMTPLIERMSLQLCQAWRIIRECDNLSKTTYYFLLSYREYTENHDWKCN